MAVKPLLLAASGVFVLTGQLAEAGFVHLQNDAGTWWLVSPVGKRMLTLGIDAIQYDGMKEKGTKQSPYKLANDRIFGSNRAAWSDSAVNLLQRIGFNTVGAWSDADAVAGARRHGTFYSPILNMGNTFFNATWGFPDVFSPGFAKHCRGIAQRVVAPLAHDPWLLGWYFDNELSWFKTSKTRKSGSRRSNPQSLLRRFLGLPSSAPGKIAADAFMVEQSCDLVKDFGVECENAFMVRVSKAYFGTIATSIRTVDPNHLLLGAKFIDTSAYDPVLIGARGFVDVHSMDNYGFSPGPSLIQHYYRMTGVPWIIAEFGFRSTINLSKDPNRLGAGPIVPTQSARADAWEVYVRKALARPEIVGFGHFMWLDEPSHGRLTGPDSNYGVVSSNGTEYTLLTSRMKSLAAEALALHHAGQGGNRCPLDTADFYSGVAGKIVDQESSLCMTAVAGGSVELSACSENAAASQLWKTVEAGAGQQRTSRLQSLGSGLCLFMDPKNFTAVRADGACTPPSWQWPSKASAGAWEHDSDCSLMQFCWVPPHAAWDPSDCGYDKQCVSMASASKVPFLDMCRAGSPQQRFSFVHNQHAIFV